MSSDTANIIDGNHDLTSILQFLIRSGQVRVITSDNHHLHHDDSDNELEQLCYSPPPCFHNDCNMIPADSNPDTSLIDDSDFKIQVLKDSGEYPSRLLKSKMDRCTIPMLRKREIGQFPLRKFSLPDKCLIASRYLPNYRMLMQSYNQKVFCGVYSKDGNLFMNSAHDANVRIYDVENDKFKQLKCIPAQDVGWSILDCVFSPDSHHFVYSSWSECLHICNVHGEHEMHETLPLAPVSRRFCVFSLSYSHDGKEIIGGACDENIYIYDIEAKRRVSRIHSHEDDVNTVAFSDDSSQILFSGGDDGLCKVWDRRTLNESSPKPVGILAGHLDGITYIDPKHDGRHLITNSKDQTIKLWDVRFFSTQEGQEATRQAVSRQNWDYRFQRVPKKLAAMKKKTVGDTSLMTYSGHTVLQTLIRCHFSPKFTTGQRYIYTGCASGSVIIYDALTGKIVTTLCGQKACVRDVSWHPTQTNIMSSSWDGTVVKWTYKKESNNVLDCEMESDSSDSIKFSPSAIKRRSKRKRMSRFI